MSKPTLVTPGARYVGLDVSLADTQLCVLDGMGEVVAEARTASDPHAIAACLADIAPDAERIGLETGATTPWLWHELRQRGLPVVCLTDCAALAGMREAKRAKICALAATSANLRRAPAR